MALGKKRVRLETLLPAMAETLKAGGTVRLPVTGTSMLPLLVQGRDTVTLKSAELPLKRDDLPLFRREDGAFILHRVWEAGDGVYAMCGDNQWTPEKGIRDGQIIGVVCEITRKGRSFSVESRGYRRYCRVWRRLMPLRKFLLRVKGRLQRWKKIPRKNGY